MRRFSIWASTRRRFLPTTPASGAKFIACWTPIQYSRRSTRLKATVRSNPTPACIRASKFPSHFRTVTSKTPGSTSITPHWDARRGSSRATIWNTCGSSNRRLNAGFLQTALVFRGLHERRDHFSQSGGYVHELKTRAISHDFLLDVDDAAVSHTALDDNRSFAEGQTQFVDGIDLKSEGGFDLNAPAGNLGDGHREKNHHAAIECAEDRNAFFFTPFRSFRFAGCRHAAGL